MFHGDTLEQHFIRSKNRKIGSTIFAYPVKNPQRYGVPELDKKGNIVSIEEKPEKPKSRYAITGIYFFDNSVVKKASEVLPSKRAN